MLQNFPKNNGQKTVVNQSSKPADKPTEKLADKPVEIATERKPLEIKTYTNILDIPAKTVNRSSKMKELLGDSITKLPKGSYVNVTMIIDAIMTSELKDGEVITAKAKKEKTEELRGSLWGYLNQLVKAKSLQKVEKYQGLYKRI